MKIYRIRESWSDEHMRYLTIGRRRPEVLRLDPSAKTARFKAGRRVCIIYDKYEQPVAYVCGKNLYQKFSVAMGTEDEYKLILDSVPKLKDARFDCAMLWIALWRECRRHKIPVSLAAWKNMRTLSEHGY